MLIDKPIDRTSADVVRELKQHFKLKKVGHGGTLDPFATGVLPLLINKATKYANRFLNGKKTYLMKMKFGASTDTGDRSGKIISESGFSNVNKNSLSKVLKESVGKQLQTPPMYSAVKYKGRRLYEYARKGILVPRQAREVTIFSCGLVELSLPTAYVEMTVSSGFYVREFAQNVATKLNSHAFLTELTRTAVCDYKLESCHSTTEIKKEKYKLTNLVIPIDDVYNNKQNNVV